MVGVYRSVQPANGGVEFSELPIAEPIEGVALAGVQCSQEESCDDRANDRVHALFRQKISQGRGGPGLVGPRVRLVKMMEQGNRVAEVEVIAALDSDQSAGMGQAIEERANAGLEVDQHIFDSGDQENR